VEEDAATIGYSIVTQRSATAWKAITIVLALILAVVLIYTAAVVTGVMKLRMSLLIRTI
jgi:hypothetical protein